uniref:Chorion transcription factor Cf2 n=1 Tax=Cacopsylla melanoneura TaxID=428564 RepID=A0A8D8UI94_9HEMI
MTSKMSNPSAFMSKVKTELEPGMYMTTYTTTNDDGQQSVLRVIEQEPLDIPVKQEPIDKPLDSSHNTLEEDTIEVRDIKLEKDNTIDVQDIKTEKDYTTDGKNTLDDNSIQEVSGTQSTHHTKKKRLIEESFTCAKCSKSFSRKPYLKKHLHTHGGSRFPCDTCSKTFLTKDRLKNRLFTHEDISFHCDKCLKSFSNKDSIRKHLLTH